jgi:hypothetical protein
LIFAGFWVYVKGADAKAPAPDFGRLCRTRTDGSVTREIRSTGFGDLAV